MLFLPESSIGFEVLFLVGSLRVLGGLRVFGLGNLLVVFLVPGGFLFWKIIPRLLTRPLDTAIRPEFRFASW